VTLRRAPVACFPRRAAPIALAQRLQSAARMNHSLTRQRGFTLMELMVVVAIVTTFASMGAFAIAGGARAQGAASLARAIHFAMIRARNEAIADGFQRRLNCTATDCVVQTATVAGMAAQSDWSASGSDASGGPQARVWSIDTQTDLAPTSPGAGPLGSGSGGGTTSAMAVLGGPSAPTVIFYPDGTASSATVFVTDVNQDHHYKVYVFAATGMARMVDSW
jgi:prepilin-type N-terminal cleavage/methylation domain-containing protein